MLFGSIGVDRSKILGGTNLSLKSVATPFYTIVGNLTCSLC